MREEIVESSGFFVFSPSMSPEVLSRYSYTEPAAPKMENLFYQQIINHILATIYKIFFILKCLSILVVVMGDTQRQVGIAVRWTVRLAAFELCMFGCLLFCLFGF